MPRGLLSRLRDGAEGPPHDEVLAIAEHLQCLLNTRRGSATAAPTYGLVALVDLVHNFPDAVATIQRSIRDTIQEHEPRLRGVSLRHVPGGDPGLLHFEISGRLSSAPNSQPLRFQTLLRPGTVSVE
jgi:type VI secretion system protein